MPTLAPATHSHDALNCNQPTNTIGHDNHKSTSDQTSAHVNIAKKKGIHGGDTHRYSRSEVSVEHKDTVSSPFSVVVNTHKSGTFK